MRKTDTKALINYVALKILGGSDFILEALYEYLVQGEGPATVAYKYGISKHQLRGYAQRIIEKSGSEQKARKIMPILIEISKGIEPLAVKKGDSFVCKACGAKLTKDDAEDHVRKEHKDELKAATSIMSSRLEEVKQRLQVQKAVILSAAQ